MPPHCGIEVFSFSDEGVPIQVGLLTESSATPIYVKGDKVKVVPLQKGCVQVNPEAGSKSENKWKPDGGGAAIPSAGEYGATQSLHELRASAPETTELSGNDDIPDADAKLEQLPFNTPVLRAWGEATGVEQRWCPANGIDENGATSDGAAGDAGGVLFTGSSYVSNAATIEVADSDADSKDPSSNSSSVCDAGERARGWSRHSTLNDMIATALPILSNISSDNSEDQHLWNGSMGLGDLVDVATSGSTRRTSRTPADGDSRPRDIQSMDTVDASAAEGKKQGEGGHVAIGDVLGGGPGSSNFPEQPACSEGGGLRNERVGETCDERKPSPAWKWSIEIRAAAMPRKARLHLFLKQRSSLTFPGPSLEEARELMKAWTPEMDKSVLELLGAVGTKSVSQLQCNVTIQCGCMHKTRRR